MKQSQYKKIYSFIKSSLYKTFTSCDNRCMVCDTKLSDINEFLCSECKEKLSADKIPKCKNCNRLSDKIICNYCEANEKKYNKIYTIFEYTDPTDRFINEFKEQGNTLYGRMFAKSLLEKFSHFQITDIDLITSVPANKIRKLLRLRDAPKFFAKALSKHINIKYSDKCLVRKGLAKAMRKKTPEQRMETANKSYYAGNYDVKDKNILLVDDVFTSGATTHVCTNLLYDMGAKSVDILVMVSVKSK